jgi:hypothetical protein
LQLTAVVKANAGPRRVGTARDVHGNILSHLSEKSRHNCTNWQSWELPCCPLQLYKLAVLGAAMLPKPCPLQLYKLAVLGAATLPKPCPLQLSKRAAHGYHPYVLMCIVIETVNTIFLRTFLFHIFATGDILKIKWQKKT